MGSERDRGGMPLRAISGANGGGESSPPPDAPRPAATPEAVGLAPEAVGLAPEAVGLAPAAAADAATAGAVWPTPRSSRCNQHLAVSLRLCTWVCL
jgi:hypothetical protein